MTKQRMQIKMLVKKNCQTEKCCKSQQNIFTCHTYNNKIRATQHSCWTTREW